MLIKSCTEKYLETSGLNFTTFRMCGFMQVRKTTHSSKPLGYTPPSTTPLLSSRAHTTRRQSFHKLYVLGPHVLSQTRSHGASTPCGHVRKMLSAPCSVSRARLCYTAGTQCSTAGFPVACSVQWLVTGHHRQLRGAHPRGEAGLGHQRPDAHCVFGHHGRRTHGSGVAQVQTATTHQAGALLAISQWFPGSNAPRSWSIATNCAQRQHGVEHKASCWRLINAVHAPHLGRAMHLPNASHRRVINVSDRQICDRALYAGGRH